MLALPIRRNALGSLLPARTHQNVIMKAPGIATLESRQVVANPISPNLVTGTIGELLVQLRLLQFGVQAAPPLKDSGNDLIALKDYEVRTIQVKCSAIDIPQIRNLPERYHLLALVLLHGHDETLLLDETEIYLVPRDAVPKLQRNRTWLASYLLSPQHLARLFAAPLNPVP